MTDGNSQPAWWRVLLAFAVVPLIASAGMASVHPLYAGLPDFLDRIARTTITYSIFGAYPSALILGVPAYFLLRRRLQPSLPSCVWVAAAVAALPWVIVGLAFPADEASIGDRVTVAGGVRTFWGWIYFARFVLNFCLIGGIAGAIFWFIAVWRMPLKTTNDLP